MKTVIWDPGGKPEVGNGVQVVNFRVASLDMEYKKGKREKGNGKVLI